MIKKDIWTFLGTPCTLCVTTCNIIRKDGRLVMGRGSALEAAQRFPSLPLVIGKFIIDKYPNGLDYHFLTYRLGNHPTTIGLLQTKRHFAHKSPLDLVKRSLEELQKYVDKTDNPVVSCVPAIGYGGLTPDVIYPLIEQMPKVYWCSN